MKQRETRRGAHISHEEEGQRQRGTRRERDEREREMKQRETRLGTPVSHKGHAVLALHISKHSLEGVTQQHPLSVFIRLLELCQKVLQQTGARSASDKDRPTLRIEKEREREKTGCLGYQTCASVAAFMK